MAKQHDEAFRKAAVERMRNCKNIRALARELRLSPMTLYRWNELQDPGQNSLGSRLREENRRLKQALVEKTLERDFFKGALQKIEARRQQSKDSGGTASTTKCES